MKVQYSRYKDLISYLFFGVCTTLVNLISYWIMARLCKAGIMLSTVIAWILAVTFAYITNRNWVFHSKAHKFEEVSKEFFSFFSCRIVTGMLDWTSMFIFADLIGINDLVVKILSNIAVIILNYIFSKLFIFKKNDKNNESIFRRKSIYSIFSVVFLAVLTLIVAMKSPLNPWTNSVAYTDSNVFKYVAMVMSRGGMPYKDAFDHKGPLLYIINYLGQAIAFYRGIWVIEYITIFGTFYMMYKTSRFYCGRAASCFIVTLASTPLTEYFEGGNLTEEYAMLCIAASIYIFLDYFLNEKINRFRLVICGLCFGAVLMLRANMISVWMVFCISVLVWNIIKRKKIPWNYLIYFLIGSSLLVAPICVWLIKGEAFSYFVNDYIIFNLKYSTANGGANIYNKYTSIMTFLGCNMFLISLMTIIYMISIKKNRFFDVTYLIYMLLTLFLISMSGLSFGHYGMILIPAFTYPLSQIYTFGSKNNIGTKMLFTVIFTLTVFPEWKENLDGMVNSIQYPNEQIVLSERDKNVINLIEDYTSMNEKIIVMGNSNYYYVLSGRLAASRYSYQPSFSIDDKISQEFEADLIDNMPKIVILTNDENDRYRKWFSMQEKYERLYISEETPHISVYSLIE